MRGEGPLRYPGAKSNLAPFVAEFVERHRLVGLRLVEPFAGSAAVSRYLLGKKLVTSAVLWELDPGAFAFWKSALWNTTELQRRVSAADVSLAEFDRCRQVLFCTDGRPRDELELGFAFLFLNRTSFSGIVGAGPIGGRSQSSKYAIHCRFNKEELVKQIAKIGNLRELVKLQFGDGIKAVEKAHHTDFLYIDPPYFSNGKKFYRKYFNTFDHYKLRKAARISPAYWLLSYDYNKKVEYLYKEYLHARIDLYHSARTARPKEEILISPLGFSGTSALMPPPYEAWTSSENPMVSAGNF